ncbi:MAG: phage ORF5 protein [Brevinema sp.]
MRLYTVFNLSIDEATNPFMCKSDKVAILNFKNGLQSVADKGDDVSYFKLYYLGEFCPETMLLNVVSSPQLVYSGEEYER